MPVEEPHRITCHLDDLLAARGVTLAALSEKVGITVVNLSILKNNRARAVRFSTLTALCEALDCEVGDFVYQTFYFLFIEFERKVVSLLVRSEPLSIVVSAEVAEEVDEICVIHCISPNINRKSICGHYKPYGQSAALFDEYYLFGKDTV